MARFLLGTGAGLIVVLTLLFAAAPIVWPIVDRAQNRVVGHDPWPAGKNAAALHARLFVADLHADSLLWNRDLLVRNGLGHVDLPRLIEGNVGLQVFTAVTKVPSGINYERNEAASDDITLLAIAGLWPARTWGDLTERALYQAEKLSGFAARSGGRLVFVRTRGDLDRVLAARDAGEPAVAALFGIEGAHALEGRIGNLDRLHAAGLRVLGLAHFFDNEVAGSAHGAKKGGLTDLGRAVVARANELGIVIDVAHASEATVAEVLELSSAPVILSHGGIRSACETGRNLPDALMARLAAKGGVAGIGYWDGAVCDIAPSGVAKSILRAVAVMGVDHVALGSDFDGATTVAFDTSELAAVTAALLAAGMGEDDVAKVMGLNALRLFRRVLPEDSPAYAGAAVR